MFTTSTFAAAVPSQPERQRPCPSRLCTSRYSIPWWSSHRWRPAWPSADRAGQAPLSAASPRAYEAVALKGAVLSLLKGHGSLWRR